MDHTYEIIHTDQKLPMHIFFHRVRYVPNHWHDSMELLFVLKGKAIVAVQGKPYVLREEDIILINSNDIHTIQSEHDNLLLALQIPDSFLREQGVDTQHTTFHCHSFHSDRGDQARFDEIRTLLSSIMWVYSKAGSGYEIKIRALLLELIYVLLRKFLSNQERGESPINRRTMDRLLKLNEYIQSHYQQTLTLNELAEQENFSVSYLSSFFQKSMGVSFRAYVTRIRLEHAVKAMLTTNEPIIAIALDSGFPNLKAFHKAFKDVYRMTPTEYRSRGETSAESRESGQAGSGNYLAYDRENAFTSLFKYLPSSGGRGGLTPMSDQAIVARGLKVRATGQGKLLEHKWRTLCTIGKAKEALFGPVQEHLKLVQQRIGFKHIRFHGIFDDEMMVVTRDQNGQLHYNFGYVDQVCDFLLGIGLRPFVELGFMPRELADQTKSFFHKKSYVSLPQDEAEWTALLQAFMSHLLDRYGQAELSHWKFEFWNEPDGWLFFPYSFEEYMSFYSASYHAIKGVYPGAQIGGPSIQGETLARHASWMSDYVQSCREQDCMPDFITIHIYPITGTLDFAYQSENLQFQYAAESYLPEMIAEAKGKLRELGLPEAELHITEWNATSHHRELTNDTCYKAAFIAKSVAETFDETSSLGYWTVTDLLEELPLPGHTFHGGLGMVTNNGIRKPAFYAYELMAKLGSRLLDRGEGYCLTQHPADNSYQLLVYHYCHYDQLYRQNDTSAIDAYNRYSVFEDKGALELSVSLHGLPDGTYRIRSYAINREHGSAYDRWVEMGGPSRITPQDVQYLNECSVPRQQVREQRIDADWMLTCRLEPHEVQLYELKRIACG
jgi:xylan 1,4-beta-xylosidase